MNAADFTVSGDLARDFSRAERRALQVGAAGILLCLLGAIFK